MYEQYYRQSHDGHMIGLDMRVRSLTNTIPLGGTNTQTYRYDPTLNINSTTPGKYSTIY